jgi:hypothetical protein
VANFNANHYRSARLFCDAGEKKLRAPPSNPFPTSRVHFKAKPLSIVDSMRFFAHIDSRVTSMLVNLLGNWFALFSFVCLNGFMCGDWRRKKIQTSEVQKQRV